MRKTCGRPLCAKAYLLCVELPGLDEDDSFTCAHSLERQLNLPGPDAGAAWPGSRPRCKRTQRYWGRLSFSGKDEAFQAEMKNRPKAVCSLLAAHRYKRRTAMPSGLFTLKVRRQGQGFHLGGQAALVASGLVLVEDALVGNVVHHGLHLGEQFTALSCRRQNGLSTFFTAVRYLERSEVFAALSFVSWRTRLRPDARRRSSFRLW